MKKFLFNVLSVLVILIFVIMNIMLSSSFAVTKNQITSEIDEMDSNISETQEKIDEKEEEISAARKSIIKLSEQISTYETEMEELEAEVAELQTSIAVQTENLEESEKNYEKQEKIFHQRLIALYESGETSYIDVLLGSENITEFLSYYYLMSEIAEADAEMLKSIESKKQEMQVKRQHLEALNEQVNAKLENKRATAAALEAAKATKKQQMNELSEEERKLQEELDEYEAHKKELQRILDALLQDEIDASGNPSEYGYISPIAGRTKSDITTRYGKGAYSWGGNHTGVDFARTSSKGAVQGLAIRAVKGGTVITSTAYKKNGKYYSYGECVIINHHDGTMTLYAHGEPGSRTVSVGDTVVQGQTIMKVGTTGNSTGYHLHFEVRIKQNGKTVIVDPTPYLP